ncbi:MAG: LEA type 2 family protein [Burkholderiaceae bacterium]|nr:LEA type 2 family protein [Burkholderiaceae bacterium]
MSPLRRSCLFAAAAAALLAGCNALPPADLEPPRLAFSDFRVEELGLSEIRFVLAVDTENPNDVEIPLRNIDFALELLGRPFAEGSMLDRAVTLPALGARTIPVQFTVPTARLLELLRSLRSAEPAQWSYRLSGSATWGWSGFPLRFDRRGDLAVLRELGRLLEAPAPR